MPEVIETQRPPYALLSRLRKQIPGFSYRDLSRKTSMDERHIARVFQGTRSVSFVSGCRLAKAAGITMEQLYEIMMEPEHSVCRKEQKHWQAKRFKIMHKKRKQWKKQAIAVKLANSYVKTPVR